jgi:hypothetical protein
VKASKNWLHRGFAPRAPYFSIGFPLPVLVITENKTPLLG